MSAFFFRVSVQLWAALLLIQLLANVPGKARGDHRLSGFLSLTEETHETPQSRWSKQVIHPCLPLHVSFSLSLCHSAFQNE